MVNRAVSPSSSPAKITVSLENKGVSGIISMGLTTPISNNSNSPLSDRGNRVSFGGNRRSSCGKFVSMSKDEAVEESDKEFVTNTVHISPIPDHQSISDSRTTLPGDHANMGKLQRSFITGTIFTGGFNSVTRMHVIDSLTNPTEPIKLGIGCGMKGCDEALEGKTMVPCVCGFNVCKDCYLECVGNGDGRCPGCKESYTSVGDDETEDQAMPSMADARAQNHPPDFDQSRRLFETKGSYGDGNAVWPKDSNGFVSGENGFEDPPDIGEKSQRSLTSKVPVSSAILIPYRLLIIVHAVIVGFFLRWRFRHPNHEAMWLWGIFNTCDLWLSLTWLLDQLPKFCVVNRATDLSMLKDRFESPNLQNPKGRSDLPGVDVLVTTADPEKEPPLVIANTILSILAVDYPVENLACYISDDAGSLLTFEALSEAVSFARIWVPFCRKHRIEPRNPKAYFTQKHDVLKNEVRLDFAREWRRVKEEYDEFKKRIQSLPESIRRRSDDYNNHEELKAKMKQTEMGGNPSNEINISKATRMSNGSYWPGTWEVPGEVDHSRGDHPGIIHVMLASSNAEPVYGSSTDEKNLIDTTDVDIRLPMLVYVSREKRPGYNDNKKAGAMNALLRTSAIMSNGPFILNLDCDHYIYNSLALREGMCFMLDKGGDRTCYVQFPQRFDGIDPNDQYANHNTIYLDVIIRALDGLQGPMYVGTCCIFRRIALYGFSPARATEHHGLFGTRKTKVLLRKPRVSKKEDDDMAIRNNGCGLDCDDDDADIESLLLPKRFGNSTSLAASIPIAEFPGRLFQQLQSKCNQGQPVGSLAVPRDPLDAATVAKAINVISCVYEDKTEWGKKVGWMYGCITEDVVTGYKMHNRGWRSVYCITKHNAFRGMAPINLTERLHQVLRWAKGSIEIFFSRDNPVFATRRMKFLQKVAYFNSAMYPLTSLFVFVYCFLPAVSLLSGQFMVQSSVTLLIFELASVITSYLILILETKWSGITILDCWRDQQFWVIGGTSAYPTAVLQVLMKIIAGVDFSYSLTSKSATPEDEDDEFTDLYVVNWSCLMIPPITIMLLNMIAIVVGLARALYNPFPESSMLVGEVYYSFWILCHLYPFAKGLMGRRGRILTIFSFWYGVLTIVVLVLSVNISPKII